MSNTSPTLGTPSVPARPLLATRAASDAPPPVRTGHCQCGRISYQLTGVPDDPHLCSCVHETRISGGPAVLWVGFPLESLIWTGPGGEPKWYATYPTLRRGFCPDCGTHLVSVADDSSKVMVTGFSLTDQSGIEPLGHSYRENAVPWMHITLAPGPIVLMSDPRVAAIPVTDCGEPLTDVRRTLLVDDRRADTTGSYAHLRRGVLDRLVHAQSLLPDGVRLLYVEGYRPPDLQRRYFEEYAGELRAANPAWPDDQVHEAASRYVSPPEIAPHSAGAAVDLTLVDADGVELDMGTRMNASPEESDGACYTEAASISPQARTNRAVLAEALSTAGLINYGTEWWHWSYGDRYWALMTNQPAALYGPRALR
ncbi:D-alanyl-D-alanine dipeptidase [Kitasatospora aureofaciens]